MIEELLTADEVASFLRVDRNTVYIWCRDGTLPAIKVGKEWRVAHADLHAFLEGRRPRRRTTSSLSELVRQHLRPSEHLLVLATDQEAVWSLELSFFSLALEKNVPLLKGCWWQHPDDVRQRYDEAGLPVSNLEASGQLVIHDFTAAYRRAGIGAVIDLWNARGQQGYFWGSGSYLTGDWLERLPQLLSFEEELHNTLSRARGLAICPVVPDLETAAGLRALFELTLHHTGTLLDLGDDQYALLRAFPN